MAASLVLAVSVIVVSAIVVSVIVHDLNFVSIALPPHEAQTPLVVNPDTMLPLALAAQGFQSISRRRCQIA